MTQVRDKYFFNINIYFISQFGVRSSDTFDALLKAFKLT